MDKPELFICECYNTEHQIILHYDEEDNITYFTIHLTTWRNPFKRFWKAMKYVFGYRCRYGDFDEFILNPRDVKRFKEHLNKLDENKPFIEE